MTSLLINYVVQLLIIEETILPDSCIRKIFSPLRVLLLQDSVISN